MKTQILTSIQVVLVGVSLAIGQEARHVTVTATNLPATIQIADYETGELVSIFNQNYILIEKDGQTFLTRISAAAAGSAGAGGSVFTGIGDTVRGPATFSISPQLPNYPSAMTVKITPQSFPPNQTLIVPAGTNQVQISLESSTNLVNWTTATNGVYGSPISANFFRIRLTNLQP